MATAPDPIPPPLRGLPTAKEKKYDRQLRLWGAGGQAALEDTHVLLVNNGLGVTGIEALKNLVLPGIGRFTIHDSAIVEVSDLGVNFFLDDNSLGKYRAQETCNLLVELNPDVKGYAVTEPLELWLARKDVLQPYTLVLLTSPVQPSVVQAIEATCAKLGVPVFHIHSVGFFSQFSVTLPSAFPIVDTHPDPASIVDLRLLKPWPALSEFAQQKTTDMDKMTGEEFAHIPYVCLLLHYLSQWKNDHDGGVPETYKEKSAFRDLVRSGSGTEENFDEAYGAVLKSLNSPSISSAVREIFNAPEIQSLTASSPAFWVIAKAISEFYSKHGELPLPGAVPDMKAQSETYIQLQNIYKTKAREDCTEVTNSVRELERDTERPQALRIDEKEIENFCKGAAHISLLRGRPLKIAFPEENLQFGDSAKAITAELNNPESLVLIWFAFLAWDIFVATHSSASSDAGGASIRVPGSDTNEGYEADATKLRGIAEHLIDSAINEASTAIEEPAYSTIKATVANICTELARAGGAELHNIASLSGGLVAQEVIKVITRQYIPVDNTCVFDGISSRTQVLRI